jgi:hypothetical protein
LIAQLYPKLVFGVDIFDDYLEISPNRRMQDYEKPVVFDEIQAGLKYRANFLFDGNGKIRSALSPLIVSLKEHIKTFIWMGTGINYSLITELLESVSAKEGVKYFKKDYNGFKPLNAEKVREFASMVLSPIDQPTRDEMIDLIAGQELCIGRGRFSARIIDAALSEGTVDAVVRKIREFIAMLGDPGSQDNPLRFLREDPGWKTIAVGTTSLHSFLLNSCVGVLTRGSYSFHVMDQQSADLVTKGIGFREYDPYGLAPHSFVISVSESAIAYALNGIFSSWEIALEMLKNLLIQPTSASAGYWFEYIVAFAVASNYGGVCRQLKVTKDVFAYFAQIQLGGGEDLVLLPDNNMGPDIVYWNGKTFVIVQVKFKKLGKRETSKANATTDVENFYTIRDSDPVKVINGYTTHRSIVTDAMRSKPQTRLLVCSQHVSATSPECRGVHVFCPPLISPQLSGRKSPRFQGLFESLLKEACPTKKMILDTEEAIWGALQSFDAS